MTDELEKCTIRDHRLVDGLQETAQEEPSSLPPDTPVLTDEEMAVYAAVQAAEVSTPALLKVRKMVEDMNLNQEQADLLLRKFAELAALQRYANMSTEEFTLAIGTARLQRLGTQVNLGKAPPIFPATETDYKAAVKTSKLARKLRRSR